MAWAEDPSARLGSWPFFIQLEIKNMPKKSQNFDFDFMIIILIEYDKIIYLKYNIQLQKYLLSDMNSKNDHKNDYNHNAGPKLGNLVVVLN